MNLQLFQRHLRHGTLTIVDAGGETHVFGSGEPHVTWRLRDQRALRRMLAHPALNVGEAYMDEMWDIEEGTLADLLTILRRNLQRQAISAPRFEALRALIGSWNNLAQGKRNASHHYDLDEALFRSFLDADMHYSCAYFERDDLTLEQAQQAKCELIRQKLCLEPGMRVFDIGSGWGSLAMYLAEHADVDVVGVTLSAEQLRVAKARCDDRGLAGRVQFLMQDYREHEGRYDAVVSVGMFEHVGLRNFDAYFNKVAELTAPDGVALIHTIGSIEPPQAINPWIQRYIFPGGYIPANSSTVRAIERAGLATSDIEVLRLHYAKTLKEWNRRFQAARETFRQRKGERFCRMWEFYLVSCQTAFELADLVVFHYQLAHRLDRIPITRDYLAGDAT